MTFEKPITAEGEIVGIVKVQKIQTKIFERQGRTE